MTRMTRIKFSNQKAGRARHSVRAVACIAMGTGVQRLAALERLSCGAHGVTRSTYTCIRVIRITRFDYFGA